MEVIKKQISLEDFTSRFNGKLQSYKDGVLCSTVDGDDYIDWGKYPVNIIIEKGSSILWYLKDKLPLVKDINGNYVLKFRTMVNRYNFLINFLKTVEFYDRCKLNDEYVWRKIEFDVKYWDGYWLYSELPDANSTTDGRIAVHPDALEFKYLFYGQKDPLLPIMSMHSAFQNFVENAYKNGVADNLVSEPFVNIPIYIEETYDDMGMVENNVTKWVNGKRYYIGDIVEYAPSSEYKLYRLKSGDSYDLVKLSTSLQFDYQGYVIVTNLSLIDYTNNKQIYKTPLGELYRIIIYFENFYNDSLKRYVFDKTTSDGNYVHWQEIKPVSNDMVEVTGRVESKLYIFKSGNSSYDDNGTELPFVFSNSAIGSIPYDIGIFDNNDGTANKLDITLNGKNKTVTFDYIIDGEIDKRDYDGNPTAIKDYTGLHYTETYPFTVKTLDFKYNSASHTESYYDIAFSEDNEDGTAVQMADIKYYVPKALLNVDANMFRGDTILGMQFSNENIDADVERGDYAAMERHNILGEIKTFEDLENYRNNFFNL